MEVGDAVSWKSQAGGSTKIKTGVIAEVVAVDSRPDRTRFPTLYKHSGCGYGRPDVSYVVVVDGKKPYWPRANALNMANVCLKCNGTGIAT